MTNNRDSTLNHYRTLIQLRNQVEPLLTGGCVLVNTGNEGIFTFLRFTEVEAVLVIINQDDETTTDYELTLDDGPLSEEMSASLLFGSGQLAAPVANATGGLEPFRRLAELPPHNTTIIWLAL